MIRALYPVYCRDKGAPHACLSILRHLGDPTEVEYWAGQFAPHLTDAFLRPALPGLAYRVFCRLDLCGHQDRPRLGDRLIERRYVRALHDGDTAYIWPAVSLDVYRRVKERGLPLVAERINCHRITAKRVLDEAYARLGWPARHRLKDEDIRIETEKMELADFIYAPSSNVADSLIEAGVPERKLLRASYGWEPGRFPSFERNTRRDGETTFVFVGRGCVRKGLPWLLEAWAKANVKGRLLLFLLGSMDAEIVERCGDVLNRPDVVIPEDTRDVNDAYRAAEVMVLPAHEEGSPLVSYEALAWSLPSLMSPMGAGAVVRDGVEGYVMDPYDTEAWAERIRMLAEDAELRRRLGENARARADEFTWDKVGRRRRELLDAARGA